MSAGCGRSWGWSSKERITSGDEPRLFALGGEFHLDGAEVAAFTFAGELDLVAGDLAGVSEDDGIAADVEAHDEGDVVAGDFAVRDFAFAELVLHGAGEFGAVGFEPEGGVHEVAVAAGDLGGPGAGDVGGEGGEGEQAEEKQERDSTHGMIVCQRDLCGN